MINMTDPVTGWPIVGRVKCYCRSNPHIAKKVRKVDQRIVDVAAWCKVHVPNYIKEEYEEFTYGGRT